MTLKLSAEIQTGSKQGHGSGLSKSTKGGTERISEEEEGGERDKIGSADVNQCHELSKLLWYHQLGEVSKLCRVDF